MQNTKTFRSMGNLTTPSAPGGVFCCRTHTRGICIHMWECMIERGWGGECRREWNCSLAYQARREKAKKRRALCAMPDTFHNLCVCISLGVAKGQGQAPEVVAQRCSRVAARKKDREGEWERETEGEEAARQWGWKLKPKLRRKTFQWPPKLSLNTNVTPNASFCHAPSPSTHTLTHLPLPLRAHVINFKWKWILWQLKFSWRFFGSSSAWHTRIHPQTHAHTHVVSLCMCVCV